MEEFLTVCRQDSDIQMSLLNVNDVRIWILNNIDVTLYYLSCQCSSSILMNKIYVFINNIIKANNFSTLLSFVM